MRTALEIVTMIFATVAFVFALGGTFDKILHRLAKNEKDLNGVGEVNRRLIGAVVRNAACPEHQGCANCGRLRDQAARLIEGR